MSKTKKIENGGPAFPFAGREMRTVNGHGIGDSFEMPVEVAYQGMSLRDWFAGMALSGLVERSGYDPEHPKFQDAIKHLAVNAYSLADAMIERNKRTED